MVNKISKNCSLFFLGGSFSQLGYPLYPSQGSLISEVLKLKCHSDQSLTCSVVNLLSSLLLRVARTQNS